MFRINGTYCANVRALESEWHGGGYWQLNNILYVFQITRCQDHIYTIIIETCWSSIWILKNSFIPTNRKHLCGGLVWWVIIKNINMIFVVHPRVMRKKKPHTAVFTRDPHAQVMIPFNVPFSCANCFLIINLTFNGFFYFKTGTTVFHFGEWPLASIYFGISWGSA